MVDDLSPYYMLRIQSYALLNKGWSVLLPFAKMMKENKVGNMEIYLLPNVPLYNSNLSSYTSDVCLFAIHQCKFFLRVWANYLLMVKSTD